MGGKSTFFLNILYLCRVKNFCTHIGLFLLCLILPLNIVAQRVKWSPKTVVSYQNYLLKGDSCAMQHDYQQAQYYYFKAQEQPKITKLERKEAYSRILSMKKYQHLDDLVANARKLEAGGYASAALKYYNDAIAYARSENINLVTPTSDFNLELIRQLSEIETFLAQSRPSGLYRRRHQVFRIKLPAATEQPLACLFPDHQQYPGLYEPSLRDGCRIPGGLSRPLRYAL